MENEKMGVFVNTLMRDNKSIKKDRAEAIIEDTQLVFKRKVEDLGLEITRLKRKQEAMLDLSPDNSLSLMPNLKDFDSAVFTEEDLKLAYTLENLKIKYKAALNRYEYLFGDYKAI
jgi:hypothetical protein